MTMISKDTPYPVPPIVSIQDLGGGTGELWTAPGPHILHPGASLGMDAILPLAQRLMIHLVRYTGGGRSSFDPGDVKVYHECLLINEDVFKGKNLAHHDTHRPLHNSVNTMGKIYSRV